MNLLTIGLFSPISPICFAETGRVPVENTAGQGCPQGPGRRGPWLCRSLELLRCAGSGTLDLGALEADMERERGAGYPLVI